MQRSHITDDGTIINDSWLSKVNDEMFDRLSLRRHEFCSETLCMTQFQDADHMQASVVVCNNYDRGPGAFKAITTGCLPKDSTANEIVTALAASIEREIPGIIEPEAPVAPRKAEAKAAKKAKRTARSVCDSFANKPRKPPWR